MRHYVNKEKDIIAIYDALGLQTTEIDVVIDELRKKHNVVIYNTTAPFVDSINENRIRYGYSVKYCSIKRGWNGRILIGHTPWLTNVYEVKRRAISIAINWILSQKSQESKK